MQSEQEAEVGVQSWSLICDTLLSRGLEPGLLFQLRQGEVGAGLALLQYYIISAVQVLLLCEVIPIPHFSITEQVLNPQQDKFILKGNPESPV